jgi:hypothetical protein
VRKNVAALFNGPLAISERDCGAMKVCDGHVWERGEYIEMALPANGSRRSGIAFTSRRGADV